MGKAIVNQRRGDGRTGPQLRAEPRNAFNDYKKRKFLNALGQSANVTASAKAAGVSPNTAYNHRRSDVQFCIAWLEAMDEAYAALEEVMLGRALDYQRALQSGDAERVRVLPQISNGDAMRLLKLHRDSVMQRRARIAALQVELPVETREALREKLILISNRLLGKAEEAPAVEAAA